MIVGGEPLHGKRRLKPLLAAVAACLLAFPVLAEIQIRLKDGRLITLPHDADEVESITFGGGPAKPVVTVPKLPEPSIIVNPPRPRGSAASPPPAMAAEGDIKTWSGVKTAVARARPGQVISIAPGTYVIGRRDVLDAAAHGTAEQPITLRAAALGAVTVEVEFLEAARISGSHWIFENLEFIGICGSHPNCEHAFHVKPNAHHLRFRNNRLIDFNAAIKGSAGDAAGATGPSYVTVEGNWIYNTKPRRTNSPVTPIDVNGGRGWVVARNYIADFAKQGGSNVSFGVFLKRNSFDGLYEGNLIVCEQRHRGGIRLGLSFGGGGSQQALEHSNGTIRNNIVMNCPQDVGIYLNRAHNTRVYNNILYNTGGIDVRYRQSTADLRNNIISSRIKNRNDGTHTSRGDRVGVSARQFADWFVDPARGDFRPKPGAPVIGSGVPAPDVAADFCGRPRGQAMDQGAIAAADGSCPMLERLWLDN